MSDSKSNSFNTYSVSGSLEEGETGHHLDHSRDTEWDFEKRFRRHADEDLTGSSAEDEATYRKVCMALFRDRIIDDKDISVTVHEGVVTLKGKVPDRKARRYAEDSLENVYGVLEVKNLLTIKADNGLVGDMNWPI